MLDDVPLNDFFFGSSFYDKTNFDLNALNNVEMIRGPSSSIYGSDSFHGAVSLESYQAQNNEVESQLELGQDGLYAASLRASHGLGDITRINVALAGRGLGDQSMNYQYTEPASGELQQGEYAYKKQQQTAVIRILSEPQDRIFYEAGLYYFDYEAEKHPSIGTQFFSGSSLLKNRDWVDSDSRFTLAKFKLGRQLENNISVDAMAYHMQSEIEHDLDFTTLTGNKQVTQGKENKQGLHFNVKQENIRWHTKWYAKFSYDKGKMTDRQTLIVDPSGEILSANKSTAVGRTRSNIAVVLQAKSALLNDNWYLLYGGRWDDFSDIGDQLTPRMGLIYTPNTFHAFKLLYGQAFRPPTASELSGIGISQGDENLKPETIDTIELVYMHQRKTWRTEIVLFYSDWINGIIIGDCKMEDGCDPSKFSGSYQNVSNNRSKGVELIFEGEWQHWFSRDSISFVSSENKDSHIDYSAFPSWILHIDGGYRFDNFGTELYISNSIYLDMTEGPVLSNSSENANKLSTYWRTDLHLNKSMYTNTRAYIDIKNLFDRENFKPALWHNENGLEDIKRLVIVGVEHEF